MIENELIIFKLLINIKKKLLIKKQAILKLPS